MLLHKKCFFKKQPKSLSKLALVECTSIKGQTINLSKTFSHLKHNHAYWGASQVI